VWGELQQEAAHQLEAKEFFSRFNMGVFLRESVLSKATMADSLAYHIGGTLQANDASSGVDYRALISHALEVNPEIVEATCADLRQFQVVDPACDGILGSYLFYKGIQAMATARVGNYYWNEQGGHGRFLARLLQSEMADVFGVDIHPGATLGKGITVDHATGVVIGETSVVGNNVYIMHDVTLGSTGRTNDHDRHPKIGDNVFLGAKCTVLGNIMIGDGATIAAAALVNKPVPPGYTAVGMPPTRLIPPKQGQPLPTSR
jgi:serine O-acetyltransferase